MAKQIVMYATGDTSLARASRAFDAQHVQLAGNIAKGETIRTPSTSVEWRKIAKEKKLK